MQPGSIVDDRFRIEESVAGGGMGEIFRAIDQQSGAVVALKLATSEDDGMVARFRRESVLLADIRHPGIVEYIAHGELRDGMPYLVMEWLSGMDLAERLTGAGVESMATVRERPGDLTGEYADDMPHPGLELAEVITLGKRVASALAAVHARGVLHRDVKPSNIYLVDGDVAKAKLVDFGTAREAMPDRPLTGTGVLVGTPYYMAPEQARGMADIGAPADVWALGGVLYQCLAGKAPFAAPQPLAALARIVVDEPTPVQVLRPDAPDDLAELVHRCLDKEPGRRYSDGRALLDALSALAPATAGRAVAEAAAHHQAGRPRAAGRRPAHHLTTRETRVCSLLFARGGSASTADARALVVDRLGGVLQSLADGAGTVLVTIETVSAPKDQAAAAAHIALALRDVDSDVRQVLATGRGRDGGHTPIADVVDTAVAQLVAAGAGEIRVDKLTAGLVESRFDVERDAGGRFLLVGERAAEGTRTLLGKPSRWVGRRREQSALLGIFDECVDESVSRAVLVSAPAGIGKSRLRFETVRAIERRGDGVAILYGQGDSLSAGSPFVMIAPAIRRSAGILDGEPLAIRRDKLAARIAETVPEEHRRRITAFVGEMVGVPVPDDDNEALRAARADKMLLGQLMTDAWLDWLRYECAVHPVLIVLEDLHWGDTPSNNYVEAALRALHDAPLMVFALARPEIHDVFPRLWEHREVEEIKLHSLSAKACAELARAALGERATDELVADIIARSEGNAFYLEELIRAVAEGAADSLPETVIGMVQARLHGLDLEARRILRAASVFGEVFWAGGVRELLGDTGDVFDVGEWLDDLARRELVTARPDARLPDEREYKFRHALVRDGAYEMLTDRDREVGHLLAGQWLERAGEQDGLVLASHFERGGDCERAVMWFERAAVQALEGNDLASAVARAERAVVAGAEGEVLGRLRALQATASYWQSDYTAGRTFGEAALAFVAEGTETWFRALGSALVSAARLGDYDTVDALFDRAMAADSATGAEAAQQICLCRGAFQLIFAGRFERADEVLARIAELAASAPEVDALTYAQVNHVQGVRAAHIGDVRVFLHHLEKAVDGFERAGDTRNVSLERTTVAWCWAEIGEFSRAESLCRDNIAYCESLRAQQAMTYGKVNLGYILANIPDKRDEARTVLLEAIDECRAVGNPRLEGWACAHLTAVEHAAGHHDVEETWAQRAAELLDVSPGLQAWALATWSRALLARGRTDEAVAKARAAMEILERLGGILQGESLPPLALARALRAAGADDEARATIADARARLARRAARLQDPAWIASFEAIEDNAVTLRLAEEWQCP